MDIFEKTKEIVKKHISEKRYNHVVRVYETADKYSKYYTNNDILITKIKLACLLHDICKEQSIDILKNLTKNIDEIKGYENNEFLHGFAASEYIKNNKELFAYIDKYLNQDFYNCLNYHTIGRKDMSLSEKLVYLCDAIEPQREYENVDKIRQIAKNNLDDAIKLEIDTKLVHLLKKDVLIHPNIILLRNSLLK